MAATYRAVINSIDRAETHVLLNGFKINEVTNGINTLVCEVGSEDASFRPVKRQAIEIYEDDGTSPERLIFGGTIRMVRERGWGEIADGIDGIIQAVSADSYKTLASRRFVTASFPSQSLEATFTSVVNTYLNAYGVTVDPTQATGPTLEAMEFELVRVDDVFNFLATLSAKYGAPFIWTIGYDKVAGMYQTGTVAAPWNLVEGDGTEVGDVEVEPTDESYANKVWVLWGSGTVVAVEDDTFTGDGVTTTFELSKKLVGPGIPETNTAVGWGYVTRSTIFFETLGDLGTGAMWEYDPVANTITRTIGAPALGEVITIDYHGENRGIVFAQNAGEIASFGLWEDKILAPEIESEALAQTVADAELARRLLTGRIVRFKTDRIPAPVPGETITITVPKRNISGSFTVTDVATENYPGDANTLLRTITCGSNIHEQSHQTLTRWWSEKDTNGIATPTGSGAVPGPPPYSVQWNDSTSGKSIFGGAYHVLYYDLFWSQPDSGETKSKGLLFVQNQDQGADGHIGITDPQRLEMGMIGEGDFSMDMFGTDASILMNATGSIFLTAGVPEVEGSPQPAGFGGGVELEGNVSITDYVAGLLGNQPAIQLSPQPFGDSYSRFNDNTVLEGVAGFYRTVSSLPFSIQVTGTETTTEFWTYIVTAGTGTIFLPWIGSAGTPNYRSFPNTLVGRMYWIVNDGGGTLTVDAGTAGTNINDASTITLADKAAVKVQRHDDGWRILASFGTVTGGGAGSGATPGGNDKDVQFNDGGVFGGESAFEYDKTQDQVTLNSAVDAATFRVRDTGGTNAIITMQSFSADGYAPITFGYEREAGVDEARTYAPGVLYHVNSSASSPPGLDAMAMEIYADETAPNAMTFAKSRGLLIDGTGVARIYQEGGLGSGAEGCGLHIKRNTTGDGASAFITLENLDGTAYSLWHDEQNLPRWWSAPPGEGGSPSGDTDGHILTPTHVIVKPSDESVTSSTALQNDNDLAFPIGANETWLIDFEIDYFGAIGGDFRAAVNVPAGATGRMRGSPGLATTAGSGSGDCTPYSTTDLTDTGVGTWGCGGVFDGTLRLQVYVVNAGTAGNVQLRWAQGTSSGTATVVRALSLAIGRKIG